MRKSRVESRESRASRRFDNRLRWLLAVASTLLAFESRLTGAEPVRPIRESILLPTDNRVPKLLLTAEEYLAERRYEELTDLLMQLTETHGRELVLAPSRSAVQVNRYVNVAQYCQRMLTDLPPAGRAVCRESALSSARMWSTGRIVS